MRQVLQSLRTGDIEVADVPAPHPRPGHLLIQTRASLVSAGTERMLVEFGKANMVQKALQQPEKVRQTLAKIRTDGLMATVDAVRTKLDQPLALGYCNAGVVLAVGEGVEGFTAGDRVVSNGAHAEIVCMPATLCARIPENVGDEAAAFTVLSSIALQGVRLAAPDLGERVVVLGLGLIGLITVQVLRAAGVHVLGADFDADRLALARSFGAETVDLSRGEDLLARAHAFTVGAGVDAVLITASTKSSEPVSQAAQMSRKRGRIVLVGVTGLELNRAEFYEKELTFQVSCSYGPGRYDPAYEAGGKDYPLGHVRWTEQRNFEAVLSLLESGDLAVDRLITHRYPIIQAQSAYAALESGSGGLGIVLRYADEPAEHLRRDMVALPGASVTKAPACGVIGAGNYAARMMIPAMVKADARLHTIVSRAGVSGFVEGRKAGFEWASTTFDAVFETADIDVVLIATPHNSHASLVERALAAGKHVFVEKPLALTHGEIERVEAAYKTATQDGHGPLLMIGFNRRFAPHVQRMKPLLDAETAPKSFVYTVNAGAIPASHWLQDPAVGGGRIIGEACHFIDLLRFLTGQPITHVRAQRIGAAPGVEVRDDKAVISLGFADGSIGTVHYFANGANDFPKERLEVTCDGKTMTLDNFRKLTVRGWDDPGASFDWGLGSLDKGHDACMVAFLDAIRLGRAAPIPLEEILEVSRVTIDAAAFTTPTPSAGADSGGADSPALAISA